MEWTYLAFDVYSREDWFLENLLVFILIGPAIYLFFKRSISEFSYFLIILFMGLHSLGAHYTYSLVPYEMWSRNYLGLSVNEMFDWKRNNYDRIIHFSWGLLLTRPMIELISQRTRLRGMALVFFSFCIIVTSSSVYELIEWGAASIFGGDLGIMYVGAQGDVWDSQKDLSLAMGGSLLAGLAFYFGKKTKAR